MSLSDWAGNGWLVTHQTSPHEIANLLAVSRRDLHDCQSPGLSVDWRLNIAYNAALQAATAALAAAGYRAARDSHHYWVIQSLAHTVKADNALISTFDALRKKRNLAGYERIGAVSAREAEEMQRLATDLVAAVRHWLTEHHPDLL